MANYFQRLFRKSGRNSKVGDGTLNTFSEESVPAELINDYTAIISRILPYFNRLNEANRQKFVTRVYNFRKIKSFHFYGLPPSEEIAILVSAAAVQVSFGLNNYLLRLFTDIHIMSDAYQADAKELYIGHIAPNGIYISWKYFVRGFSDYTDGINVALHEMAHALHHENFRREAGVDWDFRKDFEKLSSVFGPLMTQAITQRKSYLRGYAFVNFQEFWAVSVEYFFENSQGLKDNLPQLYKILSDALNQDPLHPNELPPFK